MYNDRKRRANYKNHRTLPFKKGRTLYICRGGLTQGATQRLLRLLMMTKQMRLNAFAMNLRRPIAPTERLTGKRKIFCRSPRFQARTLRIRVNYKFPFP